MRLNWLNASLCRAAASFNNGIVVQQPISPVATVKNIKGNQSAAYSDGWLLTSETTGLMFKKDKRSDLQTIISGEFKLLSVNDDLALTFDVRSDRVQPIQLGTQPYKVYAQLPARTFEVNSTPYSR